MESNRAINFLVIEDEPEVADVICLFLGGYFSASFTVATCGEEAVEILKNEKNHFQMIVSDYNMPNGNGSFVFEYVKKNIKQTPFLLVTSESWTDHKEFHNIDGVGYVSKPFIDDILIKEAERLFKTYQLDVNMDHKYVGISLPTLANINTISHPLFVKLSDDKFIKILNADSIVSADEIQKFRQKGISYLFVERVNFPSFIRAFKEKVLNQMLFKSDSLKTFESFELSAVVHEVVLGAMKNFGISKETEELARKNIDMVRNISEKFPEINSVFQWAAYSEQEYSFSHSVLICYLATEVVRNINFSSPYSSEILSLAAFFHDLSLESNQIKNELRFLKAVAMNSKINKDDLAAVKSHPLTSSESLKKWLACPVELQTVICEHHERPDGSGIPIGKMAENIHELSACFIVCEDLVQLFLDLKDRSEVEKQFADQKNVYAKEPFKRVYEFLLSKLANHDTSLAS